MAKNTLQLLFVILLSLWKLRPYQIKWQKKLGPLFTNYFVGKNHHGNFQKVLELSWKVFWSFAYLSQLQQAKLNVLSFLLDMVSCQSVSVTKGENLTILLWTNFLNYQAVTTRLQVATIPRGTLLYLCISYNFL